MTFQLVSCCNGPKATPEARAQASTFNHQEKMTLITDIAIATLVAAAATLVLLQNFGIVNLGEIAAIGSIGNLGAYGMLGGAGALVLADLIKVMAQTRSHNQAIKQTYLNTAGNLTTTTAERNTHAQTIAALQQQLQAQSQGAQGHTLTQLHASIGQKQHDLDLVTQQLEATRQALSDIEQQIDALDLPAKQQEVATLEDTKTSTEQLLEQLVQELENKRTEIDGLDLDTKQKEVQDLQTQKTQIEEQITALNLEAKQKEVQDLQAQKTQIEEQITALNLEAKQKEVQDLQTQKTQIEGEINALGLDAKKEELQQLEEQKTTLQTEVKELQRGKAEPAPVSTPPQAQIVGAEELNLPADYQDKSSRYRIIAIRAPDNSPFGKKLSENIHKTPTEINTLAIDIGKDFDVIQANTSPTADASIDLSETTDAADRLKQNLAVMDKIFADIDTYNANNQNSKIKTDVWFNQP